MAQSEPEVSVDQATSTELALKRPTLFDVVFFNDKKTHYEFVVLVLMHLFGKDYETATELTGYIHEKGRAVVATYTYEIAATKREPEPYAYGSAGPRGRNKLLTRHGLAS